jgi:hypothetical protein
VLVVGIVNIALFGFWLSLTRREVLTPGALEAGYDFDTISFQIAVMEVFLAVFAIILAVLAFFGYQFVIERAEISADAAARIAARSRKLPSFHDQPPVP